jgi:hypothetical protein
MRKEGRARQGALRKKPPATSFAGPALPRNNSRARNFEANDPAPRTQPRAIW